MHLRKLGGLRHARRDSPNMGWRNTSFPGFADYVQTSDFEAGCTVDYVTVHHLFARQHSPVYGAAPAATDVPKIKAAVLAHHGELDQALAAGWAGYNAALTAAGVPHEGYIYPGANHGFFNDTTPRPRRGGFPPSRGRPR